MGKKIKKFFIIIAVTAGVGLVDAGFLTLKHYDESIPLKCTIFSGCDFVLKSQYATVLGIPVSLAGFIYYLSILSLALVFIFSAKFREKAKNFIFALSFVGIASSSYFIFVQFFILKSICFYCLLSALFSTLIFIFSLISFLSLNRKTRNA